VKSTTAFGAFVEIMPGTEGALHISEMRTVAREDRGRRQEGRSREGEADRPRRAWPSASLDEGAAAEAEGDTAMPATAPSRVAIVRDVATVRRASGWRAGGEGGASRSAQGSSEEASIGSRRRARRAQ
jgi:polyribonucleotide nucleotidyltransferase